MGKANSLPEFDESARLTLQQRLGFSYIRLGDGAKAEQVFRGLIDAFTDIGLAPAGDGVPSWCAMTGISVQGCAVAVRGCWSCR